jgi:hypothetical protein
MAKENNYNFNFKLLRGSLPLVDQTISVPHKQAYDVMVAAKLTPDAGPVVEAQVCGWMFDLERSINQGMNHPFRCHITQLPSDVPTSMKIDE